MQPILVNFVLFMSFAYKQDNVARKGVCNGIFDRLAAIFDHLVIVCRTDAAVLAAANIADELFKEREASEALRRQLKQYIDDAAQAKNEVSELKRELFKLQNRK